MEKKKLTVVCGILVRDGLFFGALRNKRQLMGGFWEFPGGKVETGESLPEALSRELREELAIEVKVGDSFYTSTAVYDEVIVELHAFFCQLEKGEPQALEHERVAWLSSREAASLPWTLADQPILAKLLSYLDKKV